jgi:hypothetical protein
VRRLADGAGVFVYAASDLVYLLGPTLKKHTLAALRAMIRKESKAIPVLMCATAVGAYIRKRSSLYRSSTFEDAFATSSSLEPTSSRTSPVVT